MGTPEIILISSATFNGSDALERPIALFREVTVAAYVKRPSRCSR
ncbi:hypothetical protein [Saliphagus infecundisoli]|uniref:Uncharacterized protein n=1 Tax=Saliphagus infecundisoli TaxID=1849069 RepID=A0ABD5QID8_9EURY|nr:hypothetical protein [Saliphagus infecundisoli]